MSSRAYSKRESPRQLWAVYFKDHIHTDYEQKLAVFRTYRKARKWVHDYGTDECRVKRLEVSNPAR